MGSVSDVSDMLRAVAGAQLRPVIDRVFPLEEARAALDHLADANHFGKVILRIGAG